MSKPLPPEDWDDSPTTPTLADGGPFHALDDLDELDVADMRAALHRLALEAGRTSESTATRLESLGPFRDLVEIGRGGMGLVYRTLDPDSGEDVAVKVTAPALKHDPAARRRFLREANAARKLNHPGIVSYRGTGEDEGRCYLVSDLCDGPDLEVWLKARKSAVPPLEAARIVRALADAVAHAHAQGVLHRDVKPSNVLLPGAKPTSDAEEVSPRLTDFGLARAVETDSPPIDTATATGLVLGSPPYMSPEQVRGRRTEIDRRTDVYGLGAVLYTLLTLRPPFRGDTPLETMRMVVADDPIPVRVLRPGIPRSLETITLKCLEKAREARYTTAEALRDDLDAFLEGRPIKAVPIGPIERLRRWSRRRPKATAAAAAALAALVVLLGAVAAWNVQLRHHVEELRRERDLRAHTGYATAIQSAQRDFQTNRLSAVQTKLAGLIPGEDEPDLREFAWRYLRHASRREARLLSEQLPGLFRPALSPDGLLLATGGYSTPMEVYDVQRDRVIWSLDESGLELGCHPCFSRDGRLLAACLSELGPARSSKPICVEVRDAFDGGLRARRSIPAGRSILALGFLDAERLIAAVGSEWSKPVDVSIWSLESGLADERPAIRLADFAAASKNCQRFGSIGPDGRVQVYDVKGGRFAWSLERPATDLDRAVFDEEGRRLALIFKSGEVVVREAESGRRLTAAEASDSPVDAIAFHPSGQALLIRQESQEVRLVDGSSGLNVRIFRPSSKSGVFTRNMQFLPAGTEFVVDRTEYMAADHVEVHSSADGRKLGESPGRLRGRTDEWIIRPADGGEVIYTTGRHVWKWAWRRTIEPDPDNALEAHSDEVWTIAYAPDGQYFATGSDNDGDKHTIKLWEAGTRKLVRSWEEPDSTVVDLAFSPDGLLIATAHLEGRHPVRIRETAGGSFIPFELTRNQSARSVCFDASGEVLFAGGENGELAAWDIRTRERVWSVRLGTERAVTLNQLRLHDLAVDVEGVRLGSAGDDGSVRIHEPATGKVVSHYLAPASVFSIAFSPDGRTLAAADREGTIHFLDAATGRLIRTLYGDDSELRAVTYSPDGRTLAAGGVAKVIHLWDSETCQELLSFKGLRKQINSVAFSRDGNTLAAADHSGLVRFWHGPHESP